MEENNTNTIDSVVSKLQKNLPKLFMHADENIKKVEQGSYVITLSRQTTIETLIPMLRKVLNIEVLFGIGRVLEDVQKSVLYSIPNMNDMYAIYLYSERYGIIDTISIMTFYSMDDQYVKLLGDLEKIRHHKGYVYESQSAIQLTKNFI